jgi:hypothetical protein
MLLEEICAVEGSADVGLPLPASSVRVQSKSVDDPRRYLLRAAMVDVMF